MGRSEPADHGISSVRDYLSDDTILARITGTGGAVVVLRISGPRVRTVLASLCPGHDFTPRRCDHVQLYRKDGSVLDDSLVVYFVGPNSFTGEDVAEISLHGGGFVLGEVVAELVALGCRQALPGEFSFRAVRQGKLTLEQAQSVSDLIGASNSRAHALALARLSGSQTAAFRDFAETLRSALALVEAGIDFSDQDLQELEISRLKAPLHRLLGILRDVAASIERGRRIQDGISLVLAGLPNAGKSTLFNELLGEDRSLISDEAGTTRDVIREFLRLRHADHDGEATFVIHDTAGLRTTAGKVEQMGIELSRKAVASADCVLLLVEPASSVKAVEEEWKSLGSPKDRTILVMTKSDQVDSSIAEGEMALFQRELGLTRACRVSAQRSGGISSLVAALLDFGKRWTHCQSGEVILTHPEQVQAVERAIIALERGIAAESYDWLASDLRQALQHLNFFLGQTSVEEILGRIFSQFCIGK